MVPYIYTSHLGVRGIWMREDHYKNIYKRISSQYHLKTPTIAKNDCYLHPKKKKNNERIKLRQRKRQRKPMKGKRKIPTPSIQGSFRKAIQSKSVAQGLLTRFFDWISRSRKAFLPQSLRVSGFLCLQSPVALQSRSAGASR